MERKLKILTLGLTAIAVMVLVGCASTEVVDLGNGWKRMYSTSKIELKDIGYDFFRVETTDPVFSGFDREIFSMMKEAIADGSVEGRVLSYEANEEAKEIAKKGEIITYYPDEEFEDSIFIFDKIYDKELKCFIMYVFHLGVPEEAYKTYKELDEISSDIILYINRCEHSINKCNEIIAMCSNPTIQKSRVIQVPYTVTERYWVAGSIGRRTNSSFGSSEGTPGHYETRQYTAYREEIEYYTVPDPNYNPAAVAQAQKNLQSWENEKIKAEIDLGEVYNTKRNLPLPFSLIPINPSDEDTNDISIKQ